MSIEPFVPKLPHSTKSISLWNNLPGDAWSPHCGASQDADVRELQPGSFAL